MSNETSVQVGPVVKVARDLTGILGLYERLLAQALQKAGAMVDGTSLPGGEAMVALAPVAEPEINARRVELAEAHHLATCERAEHSRCWTGSEDEDDSEPILQTLLFWSEQWREEHGYPLEGRRPTVATEANLIRSLLDWAWGNEMHWDDFAGDIRKAKTRLENLLYAGERAERGAPCLYEECGGVRLVRKMTPARDSEGNKTWALTDWHCPKCKRSWDEDRYRANVAAASWAAQSEEIDGELWCSVKYAARQVGRPESTIRVWLHRGHLSQACVASGKRVGFVRLADVVERHEKTKRPGSAA